MVVEPVVRRVESCKRVVTVAVERYVLVCHAARAKQWFSVLRARYTIGLILLLTTVFSLPFVQVELRFRLELGRVSSSATPELDTVVNEDVISKSRCSRPRQGQNAKCSRPRTCGGHISG